MVICMKLTLEFELPDDEESIERLKRILTRMREENGKKIYYVEVNPQYFYKFFVGPRGAIYRVILPIILKLMKQGTMKMELEIEE